MLWPVWHEPQSVSNVPRHIPICSEPHSAPSPGCKHQTEQTNTHKNIAHVGLMTCKSLFPCKTTKPFSNLLVIFIGPGTTVEVIQFFFRCHHNKLLFRGSCQRDAQNIWVTCGGSIQATVRTSRTVKQGKPESKRLSVVTKLLKTVHGSYCAEKLVISCVTRLDKKGVWRKITYSTGEPREDGRAFVVSWLPAIL